MRAGIWIDFCICLLLLAACSAETITVNPNGTADFTTIQEAIIDANHGDTIIVADGTYTGADNRDIVFLGKAVTVRSENGPQGCFIDCEGLGRGFLIHNGEGPNSVIDGFTIINGSAGEGGAILCDGSSPTILNCIIVENEAYYGGGVSIKDSGCATLKNCVIAQNISSFGAAGIDCVNADPTIINCTITDNSSLGEAGGVGLIADSNALITNSILWADSPNEVYVSSDSSASITYSDIQGAWPGEGNIDADPCFAGSLNEPVTSGLVSHWEFDEGIGTTASDSVGVNDGTIVGAQWAAGVIGGALMFDGIDDYVLVNAHTTLEVRRTFTFSVWIRKDGNGITILSRGSGGTDYEGRYKLYAEDDLRIRYETYQESSLSTYADSFYLNRWHHVAVVFQERACPKMRIYIDGTEKASGDVVTPGANYTGLQIGRRGAGSFFNGAIDDLRIYNRTLSVDEIDQLYRGAGGYHLLPNSRCIDAGDPNYPVYYDQTDLDGSDRLVGGAVDMGAYEAQAELSLSRPQFEFSANEGRQNPPDQTLTIRNTGTRTLKWRIDCDCNWLTVEPNSGSSALERNEISLSVDSSPLTRGVYDCNLIISDTDAQNSPQTVRVELFVHAPIIELYKTSFWFLPFPDGSDPEPQTLSIRNAGGATLNWRIDHDCNWLTVEPNTGYSISEPCEVVLSVAASHLASGDYSCDLVVSDPNAENNPQIVQVNLANHEGCFPSDYPDYAEWLSVGVPECWCYARQCHGDADGKKQASDPLGYRWVSTNDLVRLANAWQIKEPPKGPGIATIPNGICADFNHKKQGSVLLGYVRVSTDDLIVLVNNWQISEPPKGPGVPADCVPVPIEP